MKRAFSVQIACLLALVGCGDNSTPPGISCEGGQQCSPVEPCVGKDCALDGGGDARRDGASRPAVRSLRIEPGDVTLTSEEGSRPSVTFTVTADLVDGTQRAFTNAQLAVEPLAIGAIQGATFTANGAIGGRARVTASVREGSTTLTASATVLVKLSRLSVGADVPPDLVTAIPAMTPVEDPKREAQVAYPLDGVVMPQNVYPVDVQWNRSAPGDVFHVSLRKEAMSIDAFIKHDAASHWLVDLAAWQALARTGVAEESVTLVVDRYEAASKQLIKGLPRSLTFARAALSGSVYYWDVVAGLIRRIDDGSGQAVSFMPTPPEVPNSAGRCIGCHSVSNSGRYMAGRLGSDNNVGTTFDLTADLSANPAPSLWPPVERGLRWWFSSWSPDDRRLIVAADSGPQLKLLDPIQGAVLPVAGKLPIGTMPDWSPNGERIAFISKPASWGDKNTRGDISVFDVTGPDSFGEARVIHVASSLPGGACDSYPTWAPDSSLIAFAHGSGARSETESSDLYLMGTNGENVTKLNRTSSGAPLDYAPNFSPFDQGGYFWLSFVSKRVYGNAAKGNVTRDATRRQQVWVAAIKKSPAPGEDPSSVPYWLPGQTALSSNLSAFWAPRACRADGQSCAVGQECCGGECRPDSTGSLTCAPPVDGCRKIFEVCKSSAECCEGSCSDGVCLDPIVF